MRRAWLAGLVFLVLAAAGAQAAPPFTYLVFGPREGLEPLPAGVELLGPERGGLLVRGPAALVEPLAERGFDLIRLDGAPPTPARRPGRPPASPPPGQDPDPAIAELIAAMSPAEMGATIQRLQDFATRWSYADSCQAAAAYLRDRFALLGLAVELDPFPLNGATACNVVAEKRGMLRPDEIYIVCGHYDSMSNQPLTDAPGADDDASGTAAVVECARAFAAQPFEATIRFIAFAGEEQGLVGSKHYVEEHVIPHGDDVRGVINLDMIAYVHPVYTQWDANWYTDDTVSLALGQRVGDCVLTYTRCFLYLVIQGSSPYGSDHFWFAAYGYPAVFDIDAQFRSAPDWDPYYHTTQDRLETLNLEYATEMARGGAAALAELAVPVEAVPVAGPLAAAPARCLGPNPFREGVTFEVGSALGALRIVDVAGREVARLGGSGRLVWRGEDRTGRAVPPGVYFYEILDAHGKLVRTR